MAYNGWHGIDRFVYAPFTSGRMRGIEDSKFTDLGRLEEQSKLNIIPIYVGRDHDKRFVRSKIEIVCLDMDCDFELDERFLRLQNQMVYFGADCYGGGGFLDGPFRYAITQEHVERRGMRYVHRYTGYSYWIGWVSFLSGAYPVFKKNVLV